MFHLKVPVLIYKIAPISTNSPRRTWENHEKVLVLSTNEYHHKLSPACSYIAKKSTKGDFVDCNHKFIVDENRHTRKVAVKKKGWKVLAQTEVMLCEESREQRYC